MNTTQYEERITRLEEENLRLRSSIEELSILNEIATAISSTLSLDKIIDLIVNKCVKHFNVEQGAVMLLDKKNENAPFHTMIRKADKTSYAQAYRLDTQLAGWMLKNQKPLLIDDLKHDQRFICPDPEKSPVRSLLSVPLMLKGEMIGLICIFNSKAAQGFKPDDQRLLSIIASESAQVIENARLYKDEQEFLSIREELRLAFQIQKDLLPKEIPKFPGYDIAAQNIPARTVSGDFYDFIPVSETGLAFCLGDVSGKGMPAALLTANLQATLKGQVFVGKSPNECIGHSNTLLYNSTSSEKFATLFYGIIDRDKHELIFCNAGHDRPFLFAKEGIVPRLQTGGIVLGFLQNFQYEEEKRILNKGELLLVYSDGVTETMNASEEEYGEERLQQLVSKSINDSAQAIIDKISTELKSFSKGLPQADDITLLIIKRE